MKSKSLRIVFFFALLGEMLATTGVFPEKVNVVLAATSGLVMAFPFVSLGKKKFKYKSEYYRSKKMFWGEMKR